jgi:hypothetical protein
LKGLKREIAPVVESVGSVARKNNGIPRVINLMKNFGNISRGNV